MLSSVTQGRTGMSVSSMSRRLFGIGLLATLLVILTGCSGEPGMIDVRVLYAGDLGLERAVDWKGYLEGHFTRVDTIDVSRLSMETAAEADVIIIDGSYEVTDNRIYLPKVPPLTVDFTRPVIMIGAAAGKTVTQMDLKIDWM
jgi:hypothetical protein